MDAFGDKMRYTNKKKLERLFTVSLKELLAFAYAHPKFSLDERRALVEAISKGGSLGNYYKKSALQTPNSLNYQYTRQGLLRVCLDKIITYPELSKNIRKTICNISALSAWAKTNPDRTEAIFNDFAKEMCPEDCVYDTGWTITGNIAANFRKSLVKKLGHRLGSEKTLDFIISSPNSFYKKYRGR